MHPRLTPVIETDILIVGGGGQGLWLLDRVRRDGFSAILLEKRLLGSQQTGHSHVYIHHGHVYSAEKLSTDVNLIDRLKSVRETWDGWLAGRSVVLGYGPSLFGFENRSKLEAQIDCWNSVGLGLVPIDPLPAIFTGGDVRAVCQSAERTLDGQWLIDELRRPHEGCIGRIHEVEKIELEAAPSGRIMVQVAVSEGSTPSARPRESFSARALLLAAGTGNAGLLRLVSLGRQPARTSPVVRKAHMLVVRGPRSVLDPLTGVFPDIGELFIVSRQTADETVWLVSDGNSPDVVYADELIECDTGRWLVRVIDSIARIAPKLFSTDQLRSQYRWGVYEAPKAEQSREHGETVRRPGHWEQIAGTGLFVILPTKLTLAPLMSTEVVEQLARMGINPSGSAPAPDPARAAGLAPVAVANERWRYLAVNPWPDFCSYYCLG